LQVGMRIANPRRLASANGALKIIGRGRWTRRIRMKDSLRH